MFSKGRLISEIAAIADRRSQFHRRARALLGQTGTESQSLSAGLSEPGSACSMKVELRVDGGFATWGIADAQSNGVQAGGLLREVSMLIGADWLMLTASSSSATVAQREPWQRSSLRMLGARFWSADLVCFAKSGEKLQSHFTCAFCLALSPCGCEGCARACFGKPFLLARGSSPPLVISVYTVIY